MKERILVGPQIKQLFEVNDCSTNLNATERRAWEAFGNVCRNFLCNEHYSDVVHELLITQRHVTETWEPSPINMAKLPSGHFQNGTEVQWKMGPNMLADCCRSLTTETPAGEYKRQKKTKWVFCDEFVCSYIQ
jgi:hypothetical protein